MKGSFRRRTRLALGLCALMLLSTLIGCTPDTPPPALEDIHDDVVALIEASAPVNDAIFGAGLPVWTFDSDFAVEHRLYSDGDDAYYQYVTDRSPYQSISQLQEDLDRVYSADYAASLSRGLFDGFVLGASIVRPQLIEKNGYLMQYTDYEPIVTQKRLYDYDTMRIVNPSNATHVTVELESHLEGEEEALTATLSLVLEQDGWRLDTPTY